MKETLRAKTDRVKFQSFELYLEEGSRAREKKKRI